MKLTDTEKIDLTPEEIRLLEAGEEPSEPEPEVAAAAPEPEPEPEPEPVAQAAPEPEPEPEPKPEPKPEPAKQTQYEVAADDFDGQRKLLRSEIREIEQKWSSGAMTDEERAQNLERLQDQLDQVLIQQTRASTLREMNEQSAAQAAKTREEAMTAATIALIGEAQKAKTVDYVKDKQAAADFDNFLEAMSRRPGAALKTPAELVADVHKAVLAMRGIAQAAPTADPKPTTREVPVTLGGLPNAGNVSVNDEIMAQVSRLSGDDLERYMAGLSAAQVERLMRMADSTSGMVRQ